MVGHNSYPFALQQAKEITKPRRAAVLGVVAGDKIAAIFVVVVRLDQKFQLGELVRPMQ